MPRALSPAHFRRSSLCRTPLTASPSRSAMTYGLVTTDLDDAMSPTGSEARFSKAAVAALIVALVVALVAGGVLAWYVVDLGTALDETRADVAALSESASATKRRLMKVRVGIARAI